MDDEIRVKKKQPMRRKTYVQICTQKKYYEITTIWWSQTISYKKSVLVLTLDAESKPQEKFYQIQNYLEVKIFFWDLKFQIENMSCRKRQISDFNPRKCKIYTVICLRRRYCRKWPKSHSLDKKITKIKNAESHDLINRPKRRNTPCAAPMGKNSTPRKEAHRKVDFFS